MSTAITTAMALVSDLKANYVFIVDRIIAGPQSWSYFAPFILLPAAILIPPSVMSHKQMICYFLVPIYASLIRAWMVMGCWDVVSLDGALWATFLLGLQDPRTEFKRVRFIASPETPPNNAAPILKSNGTSKHEPKDSGVWETNSNGFKPTSQSVVDSPSPSPDRDGQTPNPPYRMDDEAYPTDLFARIRWTLNLVASDRMVRWITGNKRHDAKQYNPTPTRVRFVLDLMPQLIASFAFLSLCTLIAHHDPYFANPHIIPISSPYMPSQSPFRRTPMTILFLQKYLSPVVVRPLTIGFYAWSLVTLEFALLAPPIILLNWLTGFPPDNWSVHTLPPYFGSFTEGALDNGVRGLWGTFWHAHLKNMVLAPGKALAKITGFDQKNKQGKRHWLGLALPMASAFLFSGLIHMGLVPRDPAFQKSGVGPWSLRLRIAAVFWVQPFGIAAEMILANVINTLVPKYFKDDKAKIWEHNMVLKTLFRAIRLAWVLTWLCCSAPLFAIPFADLGYWHISTPWFFPEWLRWLTGGGWIP